MKQTFTNCNPTILDNDTLMSWDGVFMTKEMVKENCVCKYSDICQTMIDLIDNKKAELAHNLLDNLMKDGMW